MWGLGEEALGRGCGSHSEHFSGTSEPVSMGRMTWNKSVDGAGKHAGGWEGKEAFSRSSACHSEACTAPADLGWLGQRPAQIV